MREASRGGVLLFLFLFFCILDIQASWGVEGESCGGGEGIEVTGAYGMEKMKKMEQEVEVFNIVDFGAIGDGVLTFFFFFFFFFFFSLIP